jgi:cytosine permease
VTTLAALFPALMMKLLDFVAIYGLILMPMGAVVFTDFWILPKLGMKSNLAKLYRLGVNWPAAVAWGVSLLVCFLLPMEVFFKGLPGWFLCVVLYIGGSWMVQRRLVTPSPVPVHNAVEASTTGGRVQ